MKVEDLLYRWAAECKGKRHGDSLRELTGLDDGESTIVAMFIAEKNGLSDLDDLRIAAAIGDALIIGAVAARERMKQ